MRSQALDYKDRVLTAIKYAFDKHGVDMPFPTHVVLFHDQSEESDGDRTIQREGWPAGSGKVPRPLRSARGTIPARPDSGRESPDTLSGNPSE